MASTRHGNGPTVYDQPEPRYEGREPGARRKKLAGYLKAANELRQSYFSTDGTNSTHAIENGPGAFPDASVVRHGDEEMILFPSYAKRHARGAGDNGRRATTPGRQMTEEEYWRREWQNHEDANAVVDVDVRGWIYTPQKGQNTRKQRLMIGLARQLSGIPAPPQTSFASNEPSSSQEDDLIALEAEKIVQKGRHEQREAERGAFSEKPSRATDPDFGTNTGHRQSPSTSTVSSVDGDASPPLMIHKRASWTTPSKMTSAELTAANTFLLTRLKPFMSNPMANTPISAFFFNDSDSQQRTVYTDASGHFNFRAALEFVPTHVRILAAEKLSATEAITVTPPKGVSMISDIDDTVKHSAISAGAREIFRNAFIRDPKDLTVDGVHEWYTALHHIGVQLHYVSNSPWQMYPALTSFFKLARLPKGSFHLKQYTGMLQGIFEPVAERKKSSLDRIMRDFPDRKFILVGDSGEADLEVYSDVAMDNPGKILGIFIRDVTTTVRTGYFDPSYSPVLGARQDSRSSTNPRGAQALGRSKKITRPDDIQDDDADLKAAIAASLADMEEETRRARMAIDPDRSDMERFRSTNSQVSAKPPLPPRRQAAAREDSEIPFTASPEEEDLIDFSEPRAKSEKHLAPPPRRSTGAGSQFNESSAKKYSPSPPPPFKPANLRSSSPNPISASNDASKKPGPPPRPKKPVGMTGQTPASAASERVSTVPSTQPQAYQASPLAQISRQSTDPSLEKSQPPPVPPNRRSYRDLAKSLKLTQALPSQAPFWTSDIPSGQRRPRTAASSRNNSVPSSPLSLNPMQPPTTFDELNLGESALPTAVIPPSPRRNNSSFSLGHHRRNSSRFSGVWDDDVLGSPGEGMSKKEVMWKQRLARAQAMLEPRGVTVRTWRVGSDVHDVCVKLVEAALRDVDKGRDTKNSSQR